MSTLLALPTEPWPTAGPGFTGGGVQLEKTERSRREPPLLRRPLSSSLPPSKGRRIPALRRSRGRPRSGRGRDGAEAAQPRARTQGLVRDLLALAKIPAGTAPSFPFGPDPIESCGYQLFSSSAPFTVLFVTWTVPDLRYSPGQFDPIDHFHTFVGLGFLDVHVEMTVDSAQNVTSKLWAQGVGDVNLPVRPGDVISGTLCLQTNGKAAYFLANETTQQSISFAIDTGFPPAVTINAGVTRTGDTSQPPFFHPLASFGVVYFDEISAYTTSGSRLLTSGDAITMVNQNGKTLANPVRLNDFAFKTVFDAAL